MPPYRPLARPWDRVPVPPSSLTASTTRSIRKRAPGVLAVLAARDEGYEDAMRELGFITSGRATVQDGTGIGREVATTNSRKRRRVAGWVPNWATVGWDARVLGDRAEVARWDLLNAKAAVGDNLTEDTGCASRWIPRKRHNSRWPIEPRVMKRTKTVAVERDRDEQPLPLAATCPVSTVSLTSPVVPGTDGDALVEEPKKADEKQMRRRSTRRLSRRLTLPAVVEDDISAADRRPDEILDVGTPSSRPSPLITALVTPMKSLAPRPRRLTLSPARSSFTMTATPTAVTMDDGTPSVAATPRAAVPSPVSFASVATPVSPPVDSLPVVFDQHVPEVQTEPAYERRRRVSFYNARRSDRRRSSGVRRLSGLVDKPQAQLPSRRHSFMPVVPSEAGVTNRRHTLGFVQAGPEQIRFDLTPPEDSNIISTGKKAATEDAPIEVDASANPDIFGPSPPKAVSPLRRLFNGALQLGLGLIRSPKHESPVGFPATVETPSKTENPARIDTPHSSELIDTPSRTAQASPVNVASKSPVAAGTAPQESHEMIPVMDESREPVVGAVSPPRADISHEKDGQSLSEALPISPPPVSVDADALTCGEDKAAAVEPEMSVGSAHLISEESMAALTSPADPVLIQPSLQEDPAETVVAEAPVEATPTQEKTQATQPEPARTPVKDDAMLLDGPALTAPIVLHEDSETEMLRKFVTRVKADKTAKAAAALATRAKRPSREGRGSITSATGSPIFTAARSAVIATPPSLSKARRQPLSEKSSNMSPSPSKKAQDLGPLKRKKRDDTGPLDLEDLQPIFRAGNEFSPRGKRRRKRGPTAEERVAASQAAAAAAEASADLADADDDMPDDSSAAAAIPPRRSRRVLKPAAVSAATAANGEVALIPVRVGSAADELQGSTTSSKKSTKQHSQLHQDDKELAAVTRVNTRRNQAGAIPPHAVIKRQQEERAADPHGWRLKELRGVFDALEEVRREKGLLPLIDGAGARDDASGSGSGGDDSGASATTAKKPAKKAKQVQWAENLVSIQGEDPPPSRETVAIPIVPVVVAAAAAREKLSPDSEADVRRGNSSKKDMAATADKKVTGTPALVTTGVAADETVAAAASVEQHSSIATLSASATPLLPLPTPKSTRSSRLPTSRAAAQAQAQVQQQQQQHTTAASSASAQPTAAAVASAAAGAATPVAKRTRARVSRLQPPKVTTTATSSSKPATTSSAASATLTAPPAKVSEAATAGAMRRVGMVTRQSARPTRGLGLGMGVIGTPASKKRGRAI